jgi:periplasmic protein TonB
MAPAEFFIGLTGVGFMNAYDDSPLLSRKKAAAFSAVILLHIVFGFALYSELAAQIGNTLKASPLNLVRMTQAIKQTIKPPPPAPLINSVRIHVTPPEFPSLAPAAGPDVHVEVSPIDPPPISQPPPYPGASLAVRLDPKHPLRIGAAYYPDGSRRANEMGRCLVKVTVASDGRIIAAAIQSSAGFERLDQACLNAVKGQRMLPAIEDGKSIESSILIPIVWNLSDR